MRSKTKIEPGKLIDAWWTSSSADEVAEKLKAKKATVIQIASNYRRKGVLLKRMPKGPIKPVYDWKALIELSKTYQKKFKKAS